MNRLFKFLPELTGDEFNSIEQLTQDLNDEELQMFANIYRARRRDPQMVLLLCIVGLFLIPGIQRFFVEQIGMGILFFFTIGLCFIGSIIDLVNYQQLALEYNIRIAREVTSMLKR